jgi:hypothetical protein
MEVTMTQTNISQERKIIQIDIAVSMVSMTMMFAGSYQCICGKQIES